MKKGLKGLLKKAALLATAGLISLCMVFPVAAAVQFHATSYELAVLCDITSFGKETSTYNSLSGLAYSLPQSSPIYTPPDVPPNDPDLIQGTTRAGGKRVIGTR
jgi:hypothetical protein